MTRRRNRIATRGGANHPTLRKYFPGQDEYYARVALAQALRAFEEGNYGIGAVAIVVSDDHVQEFRERNAMITGVGVVDHAETRALLRIGKTQPDATYPRDLNALTNKLPEGVSMYGTVEPCPMCVTTLTNVGAKRSVSTVLDGDLIETAEGFYISSGSASAIGQKAKLQPLLWQRIQNLQVLRFTLLETNDEELKLLSAQIYIETREFIDQELAKGSSFSY